MWISSVRTTADVKQKYVLVRIIDGSEERLILWGNPNIQWHKDILEEITNAGYEVIETFGGGWLLPDSKRGTYYVWGKSDRLGPAPISLVQQVLNSEVIEAEPE
jgi:hypothetical protein